MPAQGHDPAAGPADVAEQRLQDRRGPDVLHADRVLGPADGVAERLVRSRPELLANASATWANSSGGMPQISATISGV